MRTNFATLFLLLTAAPVLGQEPPPKQPGGAEIPQKLPIPTAEAQTEATNLIKEVYGAEWKAAKTPEQKKTMAKKLLDKAKESDSDKTAYYTLLRISSDIATQAADGECAFEAFDLLDKVFQIDVLKMKADGLDKMAPLTTAHNGVAQKAIELSDLAIAKGNYTVAKQLSDLALSESRKGRETALTKRATDQKARVEELAKAFDATKGALDILSKTPDDPDANLVVGKYYCFAEGNWMVGLHNLALGSDPALKALAAWELKGAATADEQVKLGDAWWDAPEGKPRAAYWYKQALPGLSGLTKDKVTGRIASLAAAASAEHKWVDVTDKVDPKQHTISGEWTKTNEGLEIKNADFAKIAVPAALESKYEIQIEFTRYNLNGDVALVFPVGEQHCGLLLSAWGGKASGLYEINGKNPLEGNPTSVKPGTLENNHKYVLNVAVAFQEGNRNAVIKIDLDGKPYIRYQGAVSSLSLSTDDSWGWKKPNKAEFFLGGSGHSNIVFHSVKIQQ